jgi:hypothetical protein
MLYKFSNVATAPIATSISSSVTTIAVSAGLGSLFPSLSVGEAFSAVLFDSSNNVEFVLVTARSGDVLTVARAQEGSVARAFPAASRLELRVTAAALANMVQADALSAFVALTGNQTVAGTKTFSSTIIGSLQGNVTGNLTGNVTGNVTGSVTGNVTGNITGNAATVTNGVYTTGNQTIGGDKSFSGLLSLSSPRATISNASFAMYEMHVPGVAATAWYLTTEGVTRLSTTNGGGSAQTQLLYIDGSGNFTASGNVAAYSDERLKENWRDLPDDFIERLARVKMGVYDRIDTGETQVGVGAGSLRDEALSQAVNKDSEGKLSVAYGNAALASCVALARELVALKQKLGV